MLFASITNAQIAPGSCIKFVTDTHGTVVSLADTCRGDTITISGSSSAGPWVFRAEGSAGITVHVGADYLVSDTTILPADTVIFEGDTVTVPADTTIVERMVHVPDTVVFSASGGAGTTYVSDQRATEHSGLFTIDSTGGDYALSFDFGTLNYQAYTNFSNNAGLTGSDSSQFFFNGLGFYGFMLPTDYAYAVMIERGILKTNYGGTTDATHSLVFPTNITASADSTIFTVHIKTEYVGGTRYYYVRVYKLSKYTVGVSFPITAGTLVASASVAADRFPLYGTSVQVRLDLWIRRL